MIRFDFHAGQQPKTTVRAHVTNGTGFVAASLGDTSACFYLTIEQTRDVVAQLTAGLAEHDLIANAKAAARAQAEAA